jgi:glycerol uptake facilitator-like aquaporin
MAERLAGGNEAIALLGNTIPTGAILVVLILMFGNISGAYFNPAVSIGFLWKREIPLMKACSYISAQVSGGIFGTWVAHIMFEESVLQFSEKVRFGPAQWSAEIIASFGLMATILLIRARKPDLIAYGVGLYITAAYWFTASTSFANPAVTIARALTNSFSGIRPMDAPMFIGAQIVGALLAVGFCDWLLKKPPVEDEKLPRY